MSTATLPPAPPESKPPPDAPADKPNGKAAAATVPVANDLAAELEKLNKRHKQEVLIEAAIAEKDSQIGTTTREIDQLKGQLKHQEGQREELVGQLRSLVRGEPIQENLPFSTSGKLTEVKAVLDGDQQAFDAATLKQIGIKPALAAKLEADGIKNGLELAKWFNTVPRRPIKGVREASHDQVQEAMAEWFLKRQKDREGKPGPKLEKGRNSLVCGKAEPDAVPIDQAMGKRGGKKK